MWETKKEILDYYNIEHESEAMDVLKNMIKQKHPDKSGGEFSNDEAKCDYYELSSALEVLQNEDLEVIKDKNDDLINTEVLSLVKQLGERINKSSKSEDFSRISKAFSEKKMKSRKYKNTAIILGTIILGMLEAYKKTISNTFFSKIRVEHEVLINCSFVLLVLMVIGVVIVRTRWENRDIKLYNYLCSDKYQEYIYKMVTGNFARTTEGTMRKHSRLFAEIEGDFKISKDLKKIQFRFLVNYLNREYYRFNQGILDGGIKVAFDQNIGSFFSEKNLAYHALFKLFEKVGLNRELELNNRRFSRVQLIKHLRIDIEFRVARTLESELEKKVRIKTEYYDELAKDIADIFIENAIQKNIIEFKGTCLFDKEYLVHDMKESS